LISPEASIAALAACYCGYIDARTGYIPNRIVYPALLSILLVALAFGRCEAAAGGALNVGGPLILLHLITLQRGLGWGDVKLGLCIGAGLGPICGFIALASSFIVGGMVAACLLLSGRAGRKDTVPFGPFLALGAFISLGLSPRLIPWL
jgi:leader peptidase (prepilin peptidase)/N-methyltransferase